MTQLSYLILRNQSQTLSNGDHIVSKAVVSQTGLFVSDITYRIFLSSS